MPITRQTSGTQPVKESQPSTTENQRHDIDLRNIAKPQPGSKPVSGNKTVSKEPESNVQSQASVNGGDFAPGQTVASQSSAGTSSTQPSSSGSDMDTSKPKERKEVIL